MTCGVWITIALFVGLFLGVLVNSVCTMFNRSCDDEE